jgi:hypothetical protein
MGDAADMAFEAAEKAEMMFEEKMFGIDKMSDAELVSVLQEHLPNVSDRFLERQPKDKVLSICNYYRERGKLSEKQRYCLEVTYAEISDYEG